MKGHEPHFILLRHFKVFFPSYSYFDAPIHILLLMEVETFELYFRDDDEIL